MVMGPIPHPFYCEVVPLIECCCVWNAMPVDQDFYKSLDSGSMERKDKHMHGLSVYSWGTNGSFKTKGASVVTLSPSGHSLFL